MVAAHSHISGSDLYLIPLQLSSQIQRLKIGWVRPACLPTFYLQSDFCYCCCCFLKKKKKKKKRNKTNLLHHTRNIMSLQISNIFIGCHFLEFFCLFLCFLLMKRVKKISPLGSHCKKKTDNKKNTCKCELNNNFLIHNKDDIIIQEVYPVLVHLQQHTTQ